MPTFAYKGEAKPPPTSSPRRYCRFAALCIALLLCSVSCSFAQPSPPALSKTKTSQGSSKKVTPAPHADTWAFSSKNPRPVDQIWTRGIAPQAIKQAAVAGLKNKALKNGVKAPTVPEVKPPASSKGRITNLEAPPQIPEGEGLLLGKNMRVRSDTMSSSWHNSTLKNDMRIDQDVIRQETNVYGAYAEIESSEDFSLSAGPEFSHTRTQNSTQHAPADTGSLGLSMQLKWGF